MKQKQHSIIKKKRLFGNIFLSLYIFFLVTACYTPKKIKYLQENIKSLENSKFTEKETVYRLQAGDNLLIQLSSSDPAINHALNLSNQNTMRQGGIADKYIDIYMIDKNGYIKHKQVEKLKVSGLTIEQAKDSIEARIGAFYQHVTANVRIADSYVTIIGEVQSPGRYVIDYDDKISIFSLIALAGDLKIEGSRKNIQLIRKNGEDTKIVNIDITNKDIVESEYYYVMPNDIVYIEPMKSSFWSPRNFPFITTVSLILSTTTSIFVFYNYFK